MGGQAKSLPLKQRLINLIKQRTSAKDSPLRYVYQEKMGNAYRTGIGEGHLKHRNKKPKLTFKELLAKYQRENKAKSSYRPNNVEELRSHQKRKFEGRNWRRNGFLAAAPYSFSGPSMPTSHGYHRTDFCSYFPRDWYGPKTHPPSHLRPHHVQYAAQKSPVFESFSRDCFDQKKRSEPNEKREKW